MLELQKLKSQEEITAEEAFEKVKRVFQLAKDTWMSLEIGGRETRRTLAAREAWEVAKLVFAAGEKKYYAAIPSGEESGEETNEAEPSSNSDLSAIEVQ
jgi:hypothetical protein